MNRSLSCAILAIALAAVSTPSWAQKCGAKEQCTGGLICCYGPEGSTPGVPHVAEKRGVCTKRSECVQSQGENIVTPEGAPCPKHNRRCTLTLSSGAKVTGCFPDARCDAGK